MFHLEQAIGEWRQQMCAAGIKTPVPLEELENHLREEFELQINSGTNAGRAFALAVERIGKPEKIREEFDKVEDTVKTRRLELLLRWIIPGELALVYVTIGITWLLGASSGKLEISGADIALALASLLPTLLLFRAARPLAKILPVIHEYWAIGIFVSLIFLWAASIRDWVEILPADDAGAAEFAKDLVNSSIFALWMSSLLMGFSACFIRWGYRCETIRKNSLKHA